VLRELRRQIGTANFDEKRRSLPYLFTENEVSMLSGILNSDTVIAKRIKELE
jgi:hypothetical protein